jgi:hypothetical protein
MNKTYLLIVLLLMLILPSIAIIVEFSVSKQQLSFIEITGKWFVFFAIGVRLFTAGLKQTITPSFTAQTIFHLKEKESFVIVRELGFANICFGIMGLASVFIPSWRMVAACIGGLFFGIAGIMHIIKKPVGADEWIALLSDVFIFLVMVGYVVGESGV